MVTNCLKMEAMSVLKMLFRLYQNRHASMDSVQHNFHVTDHVAKKLKRIKTSCQLVSYPIYTFKLVRS